MGGCAYAGEGQEIQKIIYFILLAHLSLADFATMSPELLHTASANANVSAPRHIIKALRLSILNLHIHPIIHTAPSHPYTNFLAMSSNPTERSQSRGREPVAVYVSITPSSLTSPSLIITS